MCMEPSEPPKPANLMSDSDLAADADGCRCSDASFAPIRSSNMMQQTKVNKVGTWRIFQSSHSSLRKDCGMSYSWARARATLGLVENTIP